MAPSEVKSPRISVIVLSFNEEVNLPGCLKSLEGLDCEVFVVDSGSIDRTVEIAKQIGATVVTHQFENYSVQRNWAQQCLPLTSEWVLHLDADERLTPELVAEINESLGRNGAAVDGFLLRRRTVFMGRWIRYGGHYPSYQLRLFRRDRGRCEDRLYDQHFIVRGSAVKLAHDYVDIVTSDLSTWSGRHLRWAKLEAAETIGGARTGNRVQARITGDVIERKRWLRERVFWRCPLFIRVVCYWFYRYVVRLGFLDGVEGLMFHTLQGFWYRILVDAHIYEIRRCGRVARAS